MSPSDVRRCSWWEFSVAIAGWIAANTSEEHQPMSQQDEDELWQGIMERMG